MFFSYFISVSICPVLATVVVSEQANDPSVKGLQKCFDPKCEERLDSDSCDGVVGCYWCVQDKYDAALDEKYWADINKCYGGREGRIGTLVAQIRIKITDKHQDLQPKIEDIFFAIIAIIRIKMHQ